MFLTLRTFDKLPQDIKEFLAALETTQVDYSGLDADSRATTEVLIEIFKSLLSILTNNEGNALSSFAPYVSILQEHLKKPGIAGWLACRGAIILLQTVLFDKLKQTGRNKPLHSISFESLIESQQELKDLRDDIYRFYIEPQQDSVSRNQEEGTRLDFLIHGVFQPHLTEFMPRRILIEEKGEYIAIADLLACHICQGADLQFGWIKYIPLDTRIVRPLIDQCKKKHYLPMLSALNKWHFVTIGIGRPLLTSQLQSILKIARNTSDSNLLGGTLIAVSTSKFLHIAGVDLILKMIHSDPTKSSFAGLIFGRRYARVNDADINGTKVLREIAKGILQSPKEYSLRVVSFAAEYMAENTPVNLPPLLMEEESLGLTVHS